MMSANEIRTERLTELSQMVVNGEIFSKLDQIATVYINGRYYFNVFRRYNSAYNIVIEDYNSDIYLHQDHTVRRSLMTILCLPECEASKVYTCNATSFKHNGPVYGDKAIADMRWSEIHGQFQAITVNFGGIFYQAPLLPIPDEVIQPPSTPIAQLIQSVFIPPTPVKVTSEDMYGAKTLLTLSIPLNTNTFMMSESDGPTLSMRFADVKKRQQERYSEMSEFDESEYEDESDSEYEDEDDEKNYIVLRNGTMIPKNI